MLEIFTMFTDIWYAFCGMLDGLVINVAGAPISFLSVLLGFLALNIIISFFWKGGSI